MVAQTIDQDADAGRPTDDFKGALRSIVRTHYDSQALRIMLGNRLCGNFRVSIGQDPGSRTDELSAEAQKLLAQLKEEYRRLADIVATTPPSKWEKILQTHEGLIRTPFDLSLSRRYFDLLAVEEQGVAEITVLLRRFRIWTEYLLGIKGVGPLMGACLISELDPYKARHASSFWKYSGLDVGPDGRGRSRREEHLVKMTYTDKDGAIKERDSITYNPFLKTKLMGVLAPSFLRSASPYRTIYDGYKHRLESHAVYGVDVLTEKGAKGHRHTMAMRDMIKFFLADLWTVWRTQEGLTVTPTYAQAKLGLWHGEDRGSLM